MIERAAVSSIHVAQYTPRVRVCAEYTVVCVYDVTSLAQQLLRNSKEAGCLQHVNSKYRALHE